MREHVRHKRRRRMTNIFSVYSLNKQDQVLENGLEQKGRHLKVEVGREHFYN